MGEGRGEWPRGWPQGSKAGVETDACLGMRWGQRCTGCINRRAGWAVCQSIPGAAALWATGRGRQAVPTLNSLSIGSLLCRKWDKSRRLW